MHDETFYASVASIGDKAAVSQDMGRATVLLGWERYRRFNPKEELIWLDDAEGKPRAITQRQYKVLTLALQMIEGTSRMTMRDMATALQVAPSTVSRALTKLASWGLIAYVVGRGRWAGLVIFRRAKDDGLDRFRKAAQARVRRWSEAVRRRISRLEINVASIALEGDRGTDSLYWWSTQVTSSKGATLTAQRPWTPEELREAGII